MRKQVFGRQFKRDKNQRKALFRSLLTSLVLNERIKTTHEKAKAIKGDADKLITKAKKGGERAYQLLEPELSHEAVKKIIDTLAPRFAKRQGGYTRITKIGRRKKDNAAMVVMEWTELAAKAKQSKKADKAAEVEETVQEAEIVENTVETAKKEKKTTKKETKSKPATKKEAKKKE
jgi:large subunit ribosomal protein L17